MRILMVMLALALSPSLALAKAPANQGQACDAKNRCDGELQCVKHRDGKATCEKVCASNVKCPEDQRCVKDGSDMLCRPITDLDL
ncbi:MAG TPA: hypothetical protein VGL86_09135 [Polyangia bacterium]|jgi:hypothetical protein